MANKNQKRIRQSAHDYRSTEEGKGADGVVVWQPSGDGRPQHPIWKKRMIALVAMPTSSRKLAIQRRKEEKARAEREWRLAMEIKHNPMGVL